MTPRTVAARIVADVLTDAVMNGREEYGQMANDAQREALFLEGRCPHPRVIVDHEHGSYCAWCGEDYRTSKRAIVGDTTSMLEEQAQAWRGEVRER